MQGNGGYLSTTWNKVFGWTFSEFPLKATGLFSNFCRNRLAAVDLRRPPGVWRFGIGGVASLFLSVKISASLQPPGSPKPATLSLTRSKASALMPSTNKYPTASPLPTPSLRFSPWHVQPRRPSICLHWVTFWTNLMSSMKHAMKLSQLPPRYVRINLAGMTRGIAFLFLLLPSDWFAWEGWPSQPTKGQHCFL